MLPPGLFILIATSIAAQPASTPSPTSDSANPAQSPPSNTAPAPSAPATPPTTPPPPPEIRVTLKTGVSWDGLLIRKDDRVITLLVSGIETSFDREEVKETKVLPAVEDRYRELRAAIDEHDTDRIVNLADWLRIRQRYALALEEVSRALTLDAEHAAAKRLKVIILAQQDLASKAAATTSSSAAPATKRAAFPLLSDRDIGLLKVYEIDLTNPGRLIVPRDAIDALFDKYGSNPAVPQTREGRDALYKAEPAAILDIMFRAQARDLYPMIKVADLPQSLKRFRDDVNRTWLVNSCATTACHGGEEAGRLRLTDERPSTDQAALTNLVILDRFRIKPAFRSAKADPAAPTTVPLIDYSKPAESPLLTFGLPPSDSSNPHPGAGAGLKGWKPIFLNREDPKFIAAVKWIESMVQPRPTYPITYTPPEGKRPGAQPVTGTSSPQR
ncbi:MAG: hypothetical protein KGS45_02365 [Planctomycetes bacterium]|nr:hypothetical protein [Planctomycetota bacterium]